MLKFLYAFLTFFVVLFASVAVVVFSTNKTPGMAGNLVVAIATLGATFGVYNFFKRREKKQELLNAPVFPLYNEDKLRFERAFNEIDCAAAGITEVKALVRTDGIPGFLVGIRSAHYDDIEIRLVTQELNKAFRNGPWFHFSNLEDEEVQWKFSKATPIKLS